MYVYCGVLCLARPYTLAPVDTLSIDRETPLAPGHFLHGTAPSALP